MKSLLSLLAVGLFVASFAGSAIACSGMVVTSDESAPISTALESGPVTPKPTAPNGG